VTILVDSSAWIEYLRGTGSPSDVRLTALISDSHPLAITDPVLLEVLMGAENEAAAEKLRAFLVSFDLRPLRGLGDADAAARIYRDCRRAGRTVRSAVDCLVAAVALREGLPVMATDRDFEAIAEETGLELV
jgi:hypothetical protein